MKCTYGYDEGALEDMEISVYLSMMTAITITGTNTIFEYGGGWGGVGYGGECDCVCEQYCIYFSIGWYDCVSNTDYSRMKVSHSGYEKVLIASVYLWYMLM